MLLENKNAVIYGGGGSIGGAVARAFAREGASVFLAGRTEVTLEEVAERHSRRRRTGEADRRRCAGRGGSRSPCRRRGRRGGKPRHLLQRDHSPAHPRGAFHEMRADDFMAPVETAARTTFITARAAARHMIPRGSGVILAFGGPGDRSAPLRDYYLGGTQVAFDAIETMRRQLSVELGATWHPVRNPGQRRRARNVLAGLRGRARTSRG